MNTPDHRVLGLGQLQLQRHTDLRVYPQQEQDQVVYVIEDPLRGKYFRIGSVEYEFLQRLDGNRSIRQIVAELASRFGSDALQEWEASRLAHWFVEQELADTRASRSSGQQWVRQQRSTSQKWLSWNPLFLKTRLGDPDRLLAHIYRVTGAPFTRSRILLWCLVCGLGAFRLLGQLDRLHLESIGVLAPSNWIMLLAIWFVLKLFHEMAHGLACKQFSVPVHECGLVWVLLNPMAYVDATAAWRLSDRWQRMAVSAAGIYLELAIAAIASIIWSFLPPGVASHVCYQVIFTATVSTLFFNANPFMRFDGYFILSDWWGVPNLSVLAQRLSTYWIGHFVWGRSIPAPTLPASRRRSIQLYSVIALACRVAMMAGMLVVAQRLLWGAGQILAIMAGAIWIGTPIGQWGWLVWQGKERLPSLGRLVAVPCLAVLTIWFMYAWLPWPGGVVAPAIVEGQTDAILRAKTDGFVREVLVQSNQTVTAGQELVRLENRELDQEVADLRLQILQAESRRSDLREQGDLAAEQSEHRFQQALETRLREREMDRADLVIRSPISGRVEAPNLEERKGTFVRSGTEVVRICSLEKQVRISVNQDDMHLFQEMLGCSIRVVPRSGRSLTAQLAELQPHATLQPPHIALTVLGGGPLPVRPRSFAPSTSDTPQYDLLAPRFVAIAKIPDHDTIPRHNMLAQVSFYSAQDTVGRHVLRWWQAWIDQRLGRTG